RRRHRELSVAPCSEPQARARWLRREGQAARARLGRPDGDRGRIGRMTSPPGIRNVFFDVGGTLLDLDHAHLLDALSSGGEAERRVTPDALARGEDEARVWFIGEMRRGGAPADAWNEFFTRLLRGAGVGEEAIPPLLKELWQRNV